METLVAEKKQTSISAIFEMQKMHQQLVQNCSIQERKVKLKKLKAAIVKNESQLLAALQSDLRKSAFESSVFELYTTYGEIDFSIKKLASWAKPQKVSSNLLNLMTKCQIVYEPKGVCLIIAPWNYPFNLLITPLISAIAAGNCCILKPSELSPAVSSVIAKLIKETFKENEIAVIEGDGAVAEKLLTYPFDHIFFTGSTNLGKVIMAAAAKNLTSVTLELGGKSPVIIDEDVDLEKAAAKITWGKFANAGQTCVAPDYVFVHESLLAKFIDLLKKNIESFYFKDGKLNKEDYGKIISNNHFNRIKNLVNDAVKSGAHIAIGGVFEESDRTVYPTVLVDVTLDSEIMKEEIFGPVLPVITYKNISEAIKFVRSNSKPLAMYIFSNDQHTINNILKQTSSGGVCVNDVLIHLSNPHLPFGGVNASGMGGSHGFHGFKAFSHERSVMYQSKMFDTTNMVYPPFKGKENNLKIIKKMS